MRLSLSGWSAAVARDGAVVARRKHLESPPSDSPLPPELRRQNVTVETFVPWDEQVSSTGEPPPYLAFRRLRARRRWQSAVEEWGSGQGLDVQDLRALGVYPTQPPRFGDRSRLTGQRLY
jgi:hypothetical protein